MQTYNKQVNVVILILILFDIQA